MKSDRAVIALLYRMELRMLLRDRRALIIAVAVPLLLFPLMLWSMHFTMTQQQHRLREHSCRYCVSGIAAPELRDAIHWCIAHANTSGGAPAATTHFAMGAGDITAPAHFKEVSSRQPRRDLAARKLDLLIMLENAPVRQKRAKVPVIRLVYLQNHDLSSMAAFRLFDLLQRVRDLRREGLLQAHGIPIRLEQVGAVEEENVAPPRQLAGLTLGRMLTLLLLLFLFSAGALVATDTLAGEKERKTLETLLTTAASRQAIVFAKLLLVASVMLAITLIQAANYAIYIIWKLIPLPVGLAGAVSPATVPLLILLYLPVVALVSALLLLVSGFAKTYKEAHLYFTPLLLLGTSFGVVALFPDTSLRSLLLLVPIANIALAVRDLLAGTLLWPYALFAWVITALAALGIVRQTTRLLSSERLISAQEDDTEAPQQGPARFSRHVLRWFALLWAIIVISGNYLSTPKLLPLQLVFNPLLLLGSTLLLIRYYRLDWRMTLAIRPVRPLVWLAVLVAAPCGVIAGLGFFQLTNLVLPIPPEWLANPAFANPLGNMPLWSKLLLLGALPGIGEEIAFRGLLLYGLHRRLRPVALAITVGVIFALFHFIIFRLPTTALLGILLATTALLTGSIFPGMLWHILNNTLALGLDRAGGTLEKCGPWVYLGATVLLVLALYVIYRNRSIYPGLRTGAQRGEVRGVSGEQ